MKDYRDILYLPHPVSQTRAPMSRLDRAAQFSPFAALTGYEESIEETARLTDAFIDLEADKMEMLNRKLLRIVDCLQSQPRVTVTYFQPDPAKAGGAYLTMTGRVKKVDNCQKLLHFTDGTTLPLSRIYEIQGDIF